MSVFNALPYLSYLSNLFAHMCACVRDGRRADVNFAEGPVLTVP